MILEDSETIDVQPIAVVQFLENMDRHYRDWHPDHVSFDWLDGARREHFYFDERVGGWRLRLPMRVTRSADRRSAVVRPTSRMIRLVFPWMSFAVTPDGRGCRYTHRIKLRLGPLRPLLERGFLPALRRHMRSEAENLARITQHPPVA